MSPCGNNTLLSRKSTYKCKKPSNFFEGFVCQKRYNSVDELVFQHVAVHRDDDHEHWPDHQCDQVVFKLTCKLTVSDAPEDAHHAVPN